MRISKSKYVTYCQCRKALWLKGNKPELEEKGDESVFETGTKVGELARGLFGDYVDVTTLNDDKTLDFDAMIKKTQDEMMKATQNICEAAFLYDGKYYAAVDILRKDGEGYSIYEVKSSTDGEKEKYYQDIAYQKWVLENSDINVVGTYIVCINNEYVLGDTLDIQKLFKVIDVSKDISSYYNDVVKNHQDAYDIINLKIEPNEKVSIKCFKPYDCGFFNYCTKDKPTPCVFDLYRMKKEKMVDYYNKGMSSFESLKNEKLNDKQKMQIDTYLDKKTYISKAGIKQFLDTLSYPLYFLDFETMKFAIPEFEGSRPYQQLPFQYSLHYREKIDGELMHKEYLAESGVDPRREIAEKLVEDIPDDVCILAYNMSFEKKCILDLAELFDDLKPTLLKIRENIKDLLDPFQSGYCYYPDMNGSFSIKRVLPALFPDDLSLNYHNLDGNVHNGGEAMDIFPKIKDMDKEEQKYTRESLLKYCNLDTYAMVKVLDKLIELVNN